MKIVILEKDTLVNNNDLNFDKFLSLGDVSIFDTLHGEELKNAVKDADVVLINKTKYDKELFAVSKNLKFLGIFATGYNIVDLEEAKKKNVVVCNAPNYSTDSVAQLAFTFILTLASSIKRYDESVQSGGWIKSETFSYFPYPFTELKGKTLGIFGYGQIGKKVADIGKAFGMKIIAVCRSEKHDENVEFVNRDELFSKSDFISFHCPLTEDTKKIVNERTLSLMKPTAYLINTSRGGVIDEVALANALNSGKISGAGLDVLTEEPMSDNCPLKNAKNCFITPHIAWTTLDARKRLFEIVYNNLKSFLDGKIINKVN